MKYTINNRLLILFLFLVAPFFFLVFLLSPTHLMAKDVKDFAEVVILKGEATVLLPRAKEATQVTLKMKLPKDSSIKTEKKSLVILQFHDGSKLTVGPESKVVIDTYQDTNKTLTTLMIGKIKANVLKESLGPAPTETKSKFIIKTRSASLGVRGTSFQVTFNNENKLTSLLAFEGKVAIAPVAQEKKAVEGNHNQVTIVEKGEYVGATEKAKEVSAPVLISPKQFAILRLNSDLGASLAENKESSNTSKEVLEKEIKKVEEEYAAIAKDSKHQNKNSTKVLSGGLVDLTTGIYVPPADGSKLDPKTNVYVADEKIGKVDNNGNYVSPAGVKLDATRGFIPEVIASELSASKNGTKNQEKIDPEILKKQEEIAKNLNKNILIKSESIKPLLENVEELEEDVYKKYYRE